MIKVGIVGGTGYTGVELMRLLALHPQAKVEVITSRSQAGCAVAELFPNLRGMVDLNYSEPSVNSYRDCDLVFFATPNTTAMSQATELLEAGVRVIDLAADFRIKHVPTWEQCYGATHACPELVEEAVLWITRIEPRGNSGCAPGREPGLLSDIGYTRPDATIGKRVNRSRVNHC